MARLQNKVAVVSGGGNGIGAAICERLHAEGARVVVADLDLDAAKSVSEKLTLSIACQVDAGQEAQVEELVAQARKWAGRLDIYVNSHVHYIFGGVDTASNADWDKAMTVNVKGYALGIKHASLAMSQQHAASANSDDNQQEDSTWPYCILNIGSINSFRALKDMSPYCAAKGAVLQLTRSSAYDLAKHKIRVNCICPGPTATEAVTKLLEAVGKTKAEGFDELAPHMIMRRYGQPAEIAAAAAFLVSDDASYITGTALPVDGGYLAL